MAVATAGMVGLTLAIAVAGGPVYEFAEAAAREALDAAAYVDAVVAP
jgi:hypothetical protein